MVPDSGVCDVLDVEQLPPNCQIIPVVLPKVTTSMTFTVDATTGTCSKPLPSPRPQTPSIDLIEPSRSSSLSFPSILQEVDMNRNMEATTRTCSKPLPSPRPQTPSIDLIEPIRSSSLSFPSILQEVDMNRNTDGGNPSPTIQLVPSSFKSVNAPLPVSTSILKEVDVKKNGFPMDISMVKMPPKQKKRGRPKGAGTTVIGLPLKKTKKSSKAFRMKSETEKSAIMMSWFIDDKIAETCLRSDVLVQPNHVKVPERIPMKCLDENIAINTIRKYFSFDAWKMVEEAMKTMQTKGTWLCKRCCGCLDAFESIGCDACLEWYHMKCLAMKSRPKQKFWICRDC
ncbi:hypothetical protein SNE40_021909 [Patella caerulea]|uniref:PHD-type domain-containing protein n=1 Tax=Patella caerulea TaxID=87958 RepID=A0AAN8G0J0_PATCE